MSNPNFDEDALIAEIVGRLRRNESFRFRVDMGIGTAGFFIGASIVIAALIIAEKL